MMDVTKMLYWRLEICERKIGGSGSVYGGTGHESAQLMREQGASGRSGTGTWGGREHRLRRARQREGRGEERLRKEERRGRRTSERGGTGEEGVETETEVGGKEGVGRRCEEKKVE